MSLETQLFGVSILLPAGVAAVVWLALTRVAGTAMACRMRGAMAIAAAFAAAYAAHPWTTLVPTESWHWLPYLSIAAAVAGPVSHAPGVPTAIRIAIVLVAAAAAAWVLVPDWLSLQPHPHWHRLMLASTLAATWAILDPALARHEGPGDAFILGGLALAAVAVIILSGNSKLALLTLAMLSALASCAVLGSLRHCNTLRGAAGPLVVLLTGLVYSAYLHSFSSVPSWSYVLLCVAPAGLWLDRMPRVPERFASLARAAGVLLPALIAIALAIVSGMELF